MRDRGQPVLGCSLQFGWSWGGSGEVPGFAGSQRGLRGELGFPILFCTLSQQRSSRHLHHSPSMLRSWKVWLCVLAVVWGAVDWQQQSSQTKRLLSSSPISAAPLQKSTNARAFSAAGFQITPVASYQLRALVLSTERYRVGREADLSPVDFALGWGPMSDPKVFSHLEISQGQRWYRYRWSGAPPIEPSQIVRHSANTHLIPADDQVRRQLLDVQRGQVVTLKGTLVNVDHPDGRRWRTSTTREDSGAGSCELMWVTEVRVEL